MSDRPRKPLSVLVADDEELARRRVIELLRANDGIRVVGEAASGPATLQALRTLRPDLLFLDVQMPGLSGFDVLARIPPMDRPVVVFSTAYDEYALAAFEVHAVDYLLKPYADDRFAESIRRAELAIRTRRQSALHDRLHALLDELSTGTVSDGSGPAAAPLDRIAVRTGERHAVIDADRIDWIEAAGDYARFHVGTTSHLVRTTMAALELRLHPDRFLRIHRSTIVQLDRVHQLQSDEHGEYVVLLRCGARLRVGRSYREASLRRLGVQL